MKPQKKCLNDIFVISHFTPKCVNSLFKKMIKKVYLERPRSPLYPLDVPVAPLRPRSAGTTGA